MKNKNIFSRELFFLFYLLFFFTTFLYKIADNSILYIIQGIARHVYIPGMLFAAGFQISTMNDLYPDPEEFRPAVLKKGVVWLLHFYIIGSMQCILLERHDPFPVFKNLLALIWLPSLASIFISLCFLYVFCAFLWKPIVESSYKKWILGLISILGFLCSFIPAGLIGYGAIGIFTGADNYGASPIFPYIFLILFGAYLAGKKNLCLFEKYVLAIGIILLILTGILIVTKHNSPALLLIGIIFAWVGIMLCKIVLNLYARAEGAIYQLMIHLWENLYAFYKNRQDSKFFRGLFYVCGYTLMFGIVCLFIFVPYIHEHRTLIWSVDGLGQYIPKIHRFIEYIPSIIKDILHGNMNFKQYDFSSGLGATMAISYDPIYWLYLLFHSSQIETVYSAMIILRFYLAGLSFSALILYFKNSHFAAYCTSMVYTFSGYALFAGTKHGQFITPLILLPVLIISMEQLIRYKKWYLMTVLVAVSLLCSYYFLYMNTIALGIYFVVRILCTKEYRNFVTFFTRGLIIVGSYVLGASIGIISLFTQFASYMGSSRTEGGTADHFLSNTSLFYRPEWIPDAFISFVSDSFTPGMWLKLGFAPIALFAIVLLFSRKNKRELRPLFLISSLFCIFPIFGYIFSGFSSVNNRWCYIYSCLVAFILAEVIEHLPKLTHTELRIMTGITFLYGGIIYFSTKYHTDKVFGAFGLLTVTLVVIYLVNQKYPEIPKFISKALIFGVTMITIIFNANMFITAFSDTGTHLETYVESGTSVKKITSTALKYLNHVTEDDEEFYRATNLKTYGSYRSSSLLLSYNDISTFTSTLNSGIVDYNSAMGNCGWDIVSVYDYNARTIMNELASVKYIGTTKKTKICIPYGYTKVYKNNSKNTKYIYKNEYALPLGYTYDNILSSDEASKYTALEKQDLTMMTAIVNKDNSADNSNLDSTKKLSLSAHELDITDMDLKGVTIDDNTGLITVEEGSSITFHFDGEDNAETYIAIDGDIYHEKDATEHFIKTNVSSEGTHYQYKFRIDSYSTGQDTRLLHLGYHKDAINKCKLTFQAAGTISYDSLGIYSLPMDHYADQVAALKENVLTNVKTDTNEVSGDISLDKDKMLCITLPYQSGWTAYVDGKKTTIQQINYQYMGLNLSAGEHHIELRYQLPGIRYAFLITAAGIALFLFIILFNLIRKKIKK